MKIRASVNLSLSLQWSLPAAAYIIVTWSMEKRIGHQNRLKREILMSRNLSDSCGVLELFYLKQIYKINTHKQLWEPERWMVSISLVFGFIKFAHWALLRSAVAFFCVSLHEVDCSPEISLPVPRILLRSRPSAQFGQECTQFWWPESGLKSWM